MSAKKKVIFCTYSSIYSSKVLEQLIVDTDIELAGVINSTRVLKPSLNPVLGAAYQIKNSGFRYSSYLFFITDFFKWIQPLLKFHKWPLRNIHSLAKMNNVPVLDTRDINRSDGIEFIQKNKPDFILCAHFNQLLKEPVLSIKNLECINIHPSILPSYKGVDPVFFAMRDNAEKIGVTIHKMDASFDSGEILSQSEIELNISKSLLFNNCQLFEQGVKLAVNLIKANNLEKHQGVENESINQSNYDSWPSRSDIKQFKSSGYRLMKLSGLWKQQ